MLNNSNNLAKKSVLLVGTFNTTGYRNVCEDLADRLTQNGWSVIRTSRFRFRPLRVLGMAITTLRLRKRYAVAQIDLYSGNAFFWAEAVSFLLRRLKKPYVLTLRGGNLPSFSHRHPRRVRLLLHSAHMVTAPSSYLQTQMSTYHTDIQLLPNPLEIKRYPFISRNQVRPKLVWLRAFHGSYNPLLALYVLGRLKAEFPNASLLMIGPDNGDGTFQRFQEAAVAFSLDDSVKCSGAVPNHDVPYWLNQGDIFINTTNVDNTPVSVMEAMACGLCTVSTNVGGIPYLLDDEHDALLVPPNDPDAMATAIRRILNEQSLAGRLSRNARAKADQFDWSVILPQWEELLTRLHYQ